MGVMPWSDVTPSGHYGDIDAGFKCHKNWDSCKPKYMIDSFDAHDVQEVPPIEFL